MQIEIDQSGKIDQTNLDTVIALTNGTKYTLLFKKKDKRIVEKEFVRRKFKKIFMVIIFANLVAYVIKNSKAKKSILIDTEYTGHNNFIEKIIQNNLGDKCPTIKFGFVGKESKSDELARKVAKGKIKPDYIITAPEVLNLALDKKKSGNI
jgi:hypothetical protein